MNRIFDQVYQTEEIVDFSSTESITYEEGYNIAYDTASDQHEFKRKKRKGNISTTKNQ